MSNSPLQSREWKALQVHAKAMQGTHLRDLFEKDAKRFTALHLRIDGLLFDYSRNLVTSETLKLLVNLAKTSGVAAWRDRMFGGEKINTTENRAALHPALRGSGDSSLRIDGESVKDFVQKSLEQIKSVSTKIRDDKNITDVVNIGIGGSDLGPRIVYETLQTFNNGPRIHFVSNVDGARITTILKSLNSANTAFIVTSKTFTTMETLTNATTAKDWAKTTKNFYAVSSNTEAAKAFGIAQENILPMRDWIGGRTSVWSTVGLPIAIAAGFDNFKTLLAGAKAMDDHFYEAELEKNIPVLMALLAIWYRNFLDYHTHAILPYAHNLRKFPAFIQQLDMESNGKSVDRDGNDIDYKTGPIIFGETGTNAQHAFMQLMHQGTDIIPADFIIVKNPDHNLDDHHRKLNANALAQAQALMQGREKADKPHKKFDGNRPSSTLLLDRLDPWHLGMLLALYEHRMFVQGIIWNINSFDQWGVELGKTLANEILAPGAHPTADQTTLALMQILEE
jgi:glucose-6-phosphate isomerase